MGKVIKELSAREVGIVKLVCKEFSNQEIADKLNLSRRTVEQHRMRIYQKTRTKGPIGLFKYAYKNGFVKL